MRNEGEVIQLVREVQMHRRRICLESFDSTHSILPKIEWDGAVPKTKHWFGVASPRFVLPLDWTVVKKVSNSL